MCLPERDFGRIALQEVSCEFESAAAFNLSERGSSCNEIVTRMETRGPSVDFSGVDVA